MAHGVASGREVSVSQSLCSHVLSVQREVLRTSAPGNPIAPPMIPAISAASLGAGRFACRGQPVGHGV